MYEECYRTPSAAGMGLVVDAAWIHKSMSNIPTKWFYIDLGLLK